MDSTNSFIQNLYASLNEFLEVNFTLLSYNDKNILKLNKTTLPNFISDIESNILNYFSNYFASNNSSDVLYYKTDFGLKYMGFALYQENVLDSCLIIGPYLDNPITSFEVDSFTNTNKLSSSILKSIKEFYNTIPLINNIKEQFISNSIFYMINNNPYDINKIVVDDISDDKSYLVDYSLNDCEYTIEKIRNRYKIEAKVLHYVSLGNEKEAISIMSESSFNMDERLPSAPLRNAKNLHITLNTLLRKTVEVNNIDTYLIHLTSNQYAIKIENARSLREVNSLLTCMVKSYCDLVNNHSNNKYSALVSGAINYIKLNYKNEINLQDISNALYVHPNYLSSKFKGETNLNLSEFINDLRIKESMFLLRNTNESISEIAYLSGFNDSKYFAKIFKKSIGVTASQYRNNSSK